jgi:hypothetical protein
MMILPVNDVVAVAVVHALQDLLHEHCGVLLRELSSGDDLVEQFSALANSTVLLVNDI